MSTAHEPLAMYLHLARASGQRLRPLVRDKMLVLAGAIAAERGLDEVAACCRQRVLGNNAGHLIGRYATFGEALEDDSFQFYLRKLKRDFPLEKVEHILQTLGIQLAGERETYYTEHEYAASLLGLSTEDLNRCVAEAADAVPAEPQDETEADLAPDRQPALAAWLIAVAMTFLLLGLALGFWLAR